jgi:single-strand DNA-binding protein
MSGSQNLVLLIGYVGKDPEVRFTASGDPVASFSMATSEKWKDKNGEKHEHTEWHNVTCFKGLATVIQNWVAKGDQIHVSGRIRTEEWKDREGRLRETKKVIADQVVLLGGGGRKAPRRPEQVQPAREEHEPEEEITDADVPF